jgi:hypothetical protein
MRECASDDVPTISQRTSVVGTARKARLCPPYAAEQQCDAQSAIEFRRALFHEAS